MSYIPLRRDWPIAFNYPYFEDLSQFLKSIVFCSHRRREAQILIMPSALHQYVAVPLLIVICGVIHHLVSLKVKEPFIDEFFHLRQCTIYCKFDFEVWDNKITTPPGLYLLGFGYSYLILKFTGIPLESICNNYDVLRSVNLLGGLVVLPLLVEYIKGSVWPVNLVSMPLLFTYYFLFYTDVWSCILMVGCLAVIMNLKLSMSNTIISGILGFMSLWFRQTNIIWIAFVASLVIDRQVGNTTGIEYVKCYITKGFTKFAYLIPYVVNLLLFGIFLKINGGITFGDKENHQVQMHLVQVFYCFSFINVFTWPVWLSGCKIKRYFSLWFGGVMSFLINGGLMVVIKYIIDNYTIVHPFLMADNRHYTFYIFKRIISHQYSNVFLLPIYHFGTWNIIDGLQRTGGPMSLRPITVISFILAIILTIVPSPLFEPRYYITPLIFFRLLIAPEDNPEIRNRLEFLVLNLINIIFFIIFFKYEFNWSTELSPQRIIW